MTYSLDMRKQVLKIRREEGLSMAEVAVELALLA